MLRPRLICTELFGTIAGAHGQLSMFLLDIKWGGGAIVCSVPVAPPLPWSSPMRRLIPVGFALLLTATIPFPAAHATDSLDASCTQTIDMFKLDPFGSIMHQH